MYCTVLYCTALHCTVIYLVQHSGENHGQRRENDVVEQEQRVVVELLAGKAGVKPVVEIDNG